MLKKTNALFLMHSNDLVRIVFWKTAPDLNFNEMLGKPLIQNGIKPVSLYPSVHPSTITSRIYFNLRR